MERSRTAAQIKYCLVRLLLGGALLPVAQSHLYGQSTDNLSLELRRNVVRVTAQWANGTTYDGFGFITGERDGFLYIATADHVVRGNGPDAIDRSPVVAFFQDQGAEYKAELLATRLRPGEGDLAVLRVRPPRTLAWRRDVVATGPVKRGTEIRFIGLERDWFVPTRPGVVNSVEPVGTIVGEDLNIKVGTSGAPLISEGGIVGMVVADTGAFARATPIDVIERAFMNWNYAWQLSSAPPPVQGSPPPVQGSAPPPVHECDRLAGHPSDPGRPAGVAGVTLTKIDSKKAIQACSEAAKEYPQTPRFAFQLGRAFANAGQYADAVLWYRKAADQGYAPAQTNLGSMYEHGRGGLPKDDNEAVRLYRLAAANGFAVAQNNLGFMYAQGRGGLRKDDKEAVRLYRLAADKGIALAEVNLGAMYEHGRGGLAKDEREAVRLYRLVADQGYPYGQTSLGIMYAQGRGGLAKNDKEAVRLFRLAAEQGGSHGQAHLGAMYAEGRGGLAKNDKEAVRLFRLAADQGYAYAQGRLAWMYEHGSGGLARDQREAMRLYRLAAAQGDEFAMNAIARLTRTR
jgi:TPR repeat protein